MTRLLLVLSLALVGCGEVTLAAITVPPPGKVAVLDDEADTLEISHGVALAFECNANDDYYGPCRNATASVGDDTVASVFASYSDALAPSWNDGASGPRARTAFVVVGLREGKTEVFITTSDGDVSLDVTVKP